MVESGAGGAPDIAAGRLSQDVYDDNFCDLHPLLSDREAAVEADRCYFCYDAPCMTACPTSIDIPMFIRQISSGNRQGSAMTIFDQNILGGMCARVCPTETLCEQACVRNDPEAQPVKIGALQRYATDPMIDLPGHPYERAPETGKKIAVVGAGPAGLACAHKLAMLGHTITIFDRREKSGGLNEYGIAAYKSVENFAQREVDFVTAIGGITIEQGKTLGKDLSLDSLKSDYDGVFLSIGLAGVNALQAHQPTFNGVVDAVDYIADLRQADDLSKLPVPRRAVVIGGGMTAIDIAVQIKLLGAEDVTIAYRRGKDQMNASPFEQDLAQTSGVTIKHWMQPHEIKSDNGNVCAITLEGTTLQDGKLGGTGSYTTLAADMVFSAIGQKLQLDASGEGPSIENGRILVDENQKTSVDGIWAGGDCTAGEDLTVVAVQDGKVAAASIDAFLQQTNS